MTAEYWMIGGVVVGILAAWLADAIREEWGAVDAWWTPRETVVNADAEKARGDAFRRSAAAHRADRDAEMWLRAANRSQS